jgi:hypothetical protein
MPIIQVEFNTIITFLGALCATVQGVTGFYAGYIWKRAALLRSNDVLNRAHRAFGSFATTLYLLGLFAGVNGLIGALTRNEPPLELRSPSFNIHTWGSFIVVFIVAWKTILSYFRQKPLFSKRKWLGIVMFAAWSYTWLTAAVSYYVRTLPSNPQHPPPVFLLPYRLMGLQLALPFVIGGVIAALVLRRASRLEQAEAAKRAARQAKAKGGE